MKELEKCFSGFIDSEKGEEIFNEVFSAIRKVYIQGFQDSSKEMKRSSQVIELFDSDTKGKGFDEDP